MLLVRGLLKTSKTIAAQNARPARQKSRRHQMKLGRGGLLSSDEARSIKRHRKEEEVKKVQAALDRAQSAMMRAERAARKPILDKVKAHTKEMRIARAGKRRL